MRKLLLALCLIPTLAWAEPPNPYSAPSTQRTSPIIGTVAASAVVIPGISNAWTYVTFWATTPTSGSTVTWYYATSSQCALTQTITTSLKFSSISAPLQVVGAGIAPIMVVPPGDYLCVAIAGQTAPGWIGFAQY